MRVLFGYCLFVFDEFFFLSLFLLGVRFWRGGGAGQAVVIISFCATSPSQEEDITSNNETR